MSPRAWVVLGLAAIAIGAAGDLLRGESLPVIAAKVVFFPTLGACVGHFWIWREENR